MAANLGCSKMLSVAMFNDILWVLAQKPKRVKPREVQ